MKNHDVTENSTYIKLMYLLSRQDDLTVCMEKESAEDITIFILLEWLNLNSSNPKNLNQLLARDINSLLSAIKISDKQITDGLKQVIDDSNNVLQGLKKFVNEFKKKHKIKGDIKRRSDLPGDLRSLYYNLDVVNFFYEDSLLKYVSVKHLSFIEKQLNDTTQNYFKQSKYTEAISEYDKRLNNLNNLESRCHKNIQRSVIATMAQCYEKQAAAYYRMNDLSNTKRLFEESIKLYKQVNCDQEAASVQKKLIKLEQQRHITFHKMPQPQSVPTAPPSVDMQDKKMPTNTYQ